MSSPEALREYHRRLAMYCLSGADACTAAELVEQMGTASMAANHPEECWRGLTTPMISGLMRELDGQRQVERRENRHNSRHGRLEAVWGLRDAAGVQSMPAPPATSGTAVGAAPAASPAPAPQSEVPRPRGLTHQQRLGLLQIEFNEMQERMRTEWQAFQARAARVLELEGEGA